MPQTQVKPKQLWGNPKVLISANDLAIDERSYPLAQTRGAYVEQVPAEPTRPSEPALQTPPEKPKSGFRKVLTYLWLAIVVLFVIVFISWWSDGYNSYGSSGPAQKYRLVLVSTGGPVSVLEHKNEKKLKEIAGQVNQSLVSRGITPQTGFVSSIPSA